jgi:general nucleoside transport system permease protein
MLIPFLNIRLIRRQNENKLSQVLPVILALIAAFILSAFLIWLSGADIAEAFTAMFQGAFGGQRQIIETINKATPLLLTGLAAAIAFRAKVWNIGAEGQLLAGAIAAYWTVTTLHWLPPALLFVAVLVISFLAGAFIGLIAALMKTRFNVDVIISTVMFNYIIAYFLSLLLDTVYRDPETYYKHSPKIPAISEFPLIFPDFRLHAGVVVAIIVAILIYLLIEKSPLGYEIQAIGHNPAAAKFKGINVSRTLILVMVISGGVAGLAGGGELAGLIHRLRVDISPGYGFTGIIVAMLAALHPLWTMLTALLFGALLTGSLKMQIVAGIPVALVYAIQAIVLLFVITAEFFTLYEIRRD